MASEAKNHTIALNSATATKGTHEHYTMQLHPPIAIPYLSKPRAHLESLTFQNSFTNVDAEAYGNNKVKLGWYSYKEGPNAGTAHLGDWQTTEFELDDGYYDATDLEKEMARKIKAASAGEVMGEDLWTTMNHMCQANAAWGKLDPISAADAALGIGSGISFECFATILTGAAPGGASPNLNGTALMEDAGLAAGKLLLPIKASTLSMYRSYRGAANGDEPGKWLIGSKLCTAKTAAGVDLMADMKMSVGTQIVAVHKMKHPQINNVAQWGIADAYYALELSTHSAGANTKWLPNSANAPSLTSAIVSFEPPGTVFANYRGYGVRGMAEPSTHASTGWGLALSGDDMKTVLRTGGGAPASNANSVVQTLQLGPQVVEQHQRYVKPVTFEVDQKTQKMRYYFAWPGVTVMKGSTLFTGMLGFEDENLVAGLLDSVNRAKQNPYCDDTDRSAVAALADRTHQASTQEILVTRQRSLTFNCPTLVPATYGTDGKLSLAQMGTIPVDPSLGIQTFQASHDNSVPCDLHGAYIPEIEFYLTDQAQEAVNLQKASFQATVRLYWPEPTHAKIGEAGAEADPSVGLAALEFRQY